MNINIFKRYERLRPKYRFLMNIMAGAIILLSYYPSREIVLFFSETLQIDLQVALAAQDNAFVFIALSLFALLINLLLVATLLSYVLAKYKGWSVKQAFDYLWLYKNVPEHWLKDDSTT